VSAIFRNLTAYKNSAFGIFTRNLGLETLDNPQLADNGAGIYVASHGLWWADLLAIQVVSGGRIVGESTNTGWVNPANGDELAYGRSLPDYCGTGNDCTAELSAVNLYDGLIFVNGTAFQDFVDTPALPIRPLRMSGGFVPVVFPNVWAVDPRNTAANCTFSNVQHRVFFRTAIAGADGTRNTTIYDLTGSITGTSGTTIHADNPWLAAAGGVLNTNFNARVLSGSNPFCQATLYLGQWTGTTVPLATIYSPLTVPSAVTVNGAPAPQQLGGVDLTTFINPTTTPITAHAFSWNFPSSTGGAPPVCSLTMNGAGMAVGFTTLLLADNLTGSTVDFSIPYSSTTTAGSAPSDVRWTPNYDTTLGVGTAVTQVTTISQYQSAAANVFFYDTGPSILHLKIKLRAANQPLFGGGTLYDGGPVYVNIW
jgi:hypothetical protein